MFRGRPVLAVTTGVVVGSAIANNRERKKEAEMQQQMMIRQQQEIINQQKAEAAAAAKAKAASDAMYDDIKVIVPAGVYPGMPFKVNINGSALEVVCPANVSPGMTITVKVPKQQPTVALGYTDTPAVVNATAVQAAPVAAQQAVPLYSQPAPAASAPPLPPAYNPNVVDGKKLLNKAISGGSTLLVLERDHLIDENLPQYKKYGIISIPAYSIVELVEGNLEDGLGGAFHDYITVNYNGKIGKISRKIVKVYIEAPPPALNFGDDVPPAL